MLREDSENNEQWGQKRHSSQGTWLYHRGSIALSSRTPPHPTPGTVEEKVI